MYDRCGRYYEVIRRAEIGPRGARRTAVTVRCARCGREADGPAVRDSAGWAAFQRARDAGLASLRSAGACGAPPRPATHPATLLQGLADWLGEPEASRPSGPPMALMIAHGGGGPTALADAVAKAWKECEHAEAMGELMKRLIQRPLEFEGYCSDDGRTYTTSFDVVWPGVGGDLRCRYRGHQAMVARMVRLHWPARWVLERLRAGPLARYLGGQEQRPHADPG